MHSLIAQIIACLIAIETGGHPSPATAIGDAGAAVGVLQLHKGYVDEANRLERILATRDQRPQRRWTYEDRTNRLKSIEMVEITLTWHYGRGEHDPIRLGARHHRPYGKLSTRYIKLMEKQWNSKQLRDSTESRTICH